MKTKIRNYEVNLHFRNSLDNPFVESEYGVWSIHRYCTDYGVQVPKNEYFDFSNPGWNTNPNLTTMKIGRVGCFVMNSHKMDFSEEKEYAISIRYRIEQRTLTEHMNSYERILGVMWDKGDICLIDKHANNRDYCISMTLNGERIEIPVRDVYVGDSKICHLVLAVKDGIAKVWLNAVLYYNQALKNPIYVIDKLRMGNLSFFNKNLDAIIEYDELAVLNDVTYAEKYSTDPYHSLYPEIEYPTDGKKVNLRNHLSPSEIDEINRALDISRHVDRKFDSRDHHKSHRKFKFNQDDEDEIPD
jgi:hypothetical protein